MLSPFFTLGQVLPCSQVLGPAECLFSSAIWSLLSGTHHECTSEVSWIACALSSPFIWYQRASSSSSWGPGAANVSFFQVLWRIGFIYYCFLFRQSVAHTHRNIIHTGLPFMINPSVLDWLIIHVCHIKGKSLDLLSQSVLSVEVVSTHYRTPNGWTVSLLFLWSQPDCSPATTHRPIIPPVFPHATKW